MITYHETKNPSKTKICWGLLAARSQPNDPYGVRETNGNIGESELSAECSVTGSVVSDHQEPTEVDSMLQAVIDAWGSLTDAEKALCYSMARRASGKPLFAIEQSATPENS